jgi:hypothetical protein
MSVQPHTLKEYANSEQMIQPAVAINRNRLSELTESWRKKRNIKMNVRQLYLK